MNFTKHRNIQFITKMSIIEQFEELNEEIKLAIFFALMFLIIMVILIIVLVTNHNRSKKSRPVRSNSWNYRFPTIGRQLPMARDINEVNICSFTMSRSFSVYIRPESPKPTTRGFINPGFSNDDFIDHLTYI